jgi:plastocyanin
MMERVPRWPAAIVALMMMGASPPSPAHPAKTPAKPPLCEFNPEMPLQLVVKTPDDLRFKAVAERQYLEFNLLASGKLAWDSGEFATAAAKWETLLALPGLPKEIDDAVRPLTLGAIERSGAPSSDLPPPAGQARPETAPLSAVPMPPPPRLAFTVSGIVSGGGAMGPGGTVVWLLRANGPTPRPKPAAGRVVVQKNKAFKPRVLPVPVGTMVEFRNDDDIYHSVFSLSKPNDFDLGLYREGSSKFQRFDSPGPVQLLCNIHAAMLGWLYVVDSPYYGQARGDGSFVIRNVPAGDYVLEAWNESTEKESKQRLRVKDDVQGVRVAVGGEKRAPAFVPDRTGKPRQIQLGY